MLDRLARGDLARKHHTQLRGPDGALRYEECFTRDGFEGPYTILYHLRRPHLQRPAEVRHGWATPGSYYDMLPERLRTTTIGALDEDLGVLRELEILVDGAKPHQYILQIFLKEAAGLYHDPEAGPFFFEIIQRKGSRGFGAGNFRALFESIERQQKLTRRIS